MSPRHGESTLEWAKRRAGEEHTFAVEYSGDEAAARAKVFAEVAKRLEAEQREIAIGLEAAATHLEGGWDPIDAERAIRGFVVRLRGVA